MIAFKRLNPKWPNTFSVEDGFAGRKTKCPKCGTALLVPAAGGAPGVAEHMPAQFATQIPAEIQPSPPADVTPTRPVTNHKNRPFCAELVLAAARKCKNCGATLELALRAAKEPPRIGETHGESERRQEHQKRKGGMTAFAVLNLLFGGIGLLGGLWTPLTGVRKRGGSHNGNIVSVVTPAPFSDPK
jgi:hypothetical protein